MYKRKWVFGAACAGMFLFGITFITLGSVVPGLKEKYHLSETSAGTLFSLLPFGILAGSLLFGPICDKYGYKIVLSISCFCICAGLEGIAFAPSLLVLKACICLFGLGGGAINGATNAVVADISEKDKGASLSLLGVFFGIGALGMPLLLAILGHAFHFEMITAFVGLITCLAGLGFLFIRFPLPKQSQGFPIAHSFHLVKDNVLLLIAFFLFCQSSFEAVINNWTTTYLSKKLFIPADKALYALSLYVVGMTAMRLLLGSFLKAVPVKNLLITSFALLLAGCFCLEFADTFYIAVAGLLLLGAGLAGGFPIMLGMVGHRYAAISGTAFSFVLVIALLGNTLVNYGMGIVVDHYGIGYLTKIAFLESIIMLLLTIFILRRITKQQTQTII